MCTTAVHTWKIIDLSILEKIKSCKAAESFSSDSFDIFGLKWSLELYPNGSKLSNLNKIELYALISLVPNEISVINLNTRLIIQEINYILDIKMCVNSHNKKMTFYGPNIKDILKYNTLTFVFKCNLMNVKLINGNDITKQWIKYNKPMTSLLNLLNSGNNNNKNNKNKSLSPIGPKSNINRNTLIPMRVNISSSQQIPITIPQILNTNNVNQLETEITSYKMHINKTMQTWAEQVNKRFCRLEREIYVIKHAMNANKKLNDADSSLDEEQKQLKSWFMDTIKLPEYYDIFIKNGINSLFVASLVTMNELNEMNIDKIGHKIQILYHINGLKQNNIQANSKNNVNKQTGTKRVRIVTNDDNEIVNNGQQPPTKKQRMNSF